MPYESTKKTLLILINFAHSQILYLHSLTAIRFISSNQDCPLIGPKQNMHIFISDVQHAPSPPALLLSFCFQRLDI